MTLAELCPNCGQPAPGGLYLAPLTFFHMEVRHCGCFYEADPNAVVRHIQDEVLPEFVRAGGDCICTQCSRDYYSHPLAEEWTDQDGNPYLNRLCDGRLVKL